MGSTIASNSTETQLIVYEGLCKKYSDARALVAERVANFDDEVRKLRRRLLPGIKHAATLAADLQAELRAEIEKAPGLFVKPRTMTLSGIKFGMKVSKAKVVWNDDDKLIEVIEKKLPDLADTLIRTKKELVKAAVANLPGDQLGRIGCRVIPGADYSLIETTGSEVDKLVERILEEGSKELEEGT